MDVEVERGAEALDDSHAAGFEDAAYPIRPRAPAQPSRDDADESAEHDAGECGVEGHAESKTERNGQHPLPHRDLGHDVITEMRGEVAHAAAETRRTEAAALARKRDEAVLSAAIAGDPNESMGQNAAPEERLDLVDHEARQAASAPVPVLGLGLGQERPPVLGEQPVESRLLRPMPRVRAFGRTDSPALGDRERTGSSHPCLSGPAVCAFRRSCATFYPRHFRARSSKLHECPNL